MSDNTATNFSWQPDEQPQPKRLEDIEGVIKVRDANENAESVLKDLSEAEIDKLSPLAARVLLTRLKQQLFTQPQK